MKTKLRSQALAALVAFAVVTPAFAQDSAPDHPVLGRKAGMLLTLSGKIEAIDLKTREVTLRGPSGRVETVVVDEKVKRLAEAKVGDTVTVNYYMGYVAELRKPTPEEEQNPLVVLEEAGKAGKDAPPGAVGMRKVRAVVTIEGLDRPTQTVTVKGPLGRYWVARVADPARLEQAHIGEKIVVIFTQAAAVSLEKTSKQTQE